MADIQRIGLDEVVRHFEELEDPRSTVNRQHPLVSVVVIARMAVLAGYAFMGWDPLFSRVSVKFDSGKTGGLRLSDTRKPLVFSHPGL